MQEQPLLSLGMMLAHVRQQESKCTERRKEERYPFSARLLVGHISTGAFRHVCDVYCLDLSPQGMGLLMETELPKGHVFTFKLTTPAGQHWQSRGQIMHCTKLLEHSYRAGVGFAAD